MMILWRSLWVLDHMDDRQQLAYIMQSSERKNTMHVSMYVYTHGRMHVRI